MALHMSWKRGNFTRAPLPAAQCGGATSHPSAQHVAVIDLWISSFEKCFLKTLSIFLLGFPFLTDLDWRSLKNSGTLQSGQIPTDTQYDPVGRRYSFHVSGVTNYASYSTCHWEEWIFHYVFIIDFYLNCITSNPLKLLRFDLWPIFVDIPYVIWRMHMFQMVVTGLYMCIMSSVLLRLVKSVCLIDFYVCLSY